MKKLILLGICLILLGCDISPKKDMGPNTINSGRYGSSITKIKVDGLEYHLYSGELGEESPFVINHTKELLEVQLLRKQLAQ